MNLWRFSLGFALAGVLTATDAAGQQPPPTTQGPTPTTTSPGRKSPPMPTQKPSLDYFAGHWTFKRVGAESPIAPGPGTGSVTFAPSAGGRLQGQTEATLDDGGSYKETTIIGFDDEKKTLAWSEQRPNGVKWTGVGDWSVPIAIRFTLEPIKLKAQTFQVKRVISIISANSFSVTEDVSVDGGPFVRLANSIYTKNTKDTK